MGYRITLVYVSNIMLIQYQYVDLYDEGLIPVNFVHVVSTSQWMTNILLMTNMYNNSERWFEMACPDTASFLGGIPIICCDIRIWSSLLEADCLPKIAHPSHHFKMACVIANVCLDYLLTTNTAHLPLHLLIHVHLGNLWHQSHPIKHTAHKQGWLNHCAEKLPYWWVWTSKIIVCME